MDLERLGRRSFTFVKAREIGRGSLLKPVWVALYHEKRGIAPLGSFLRALGTFVYNRSPMVFLSIHRRVGIHCGRSVQTAWNAGLRASRVSAICRATTQQTSDRRILCEPRADAQSAHRSGQQTDRPLPHATSTQRTVEHGPTSSPRVKGKPPRAPAGQRGRGHV